MKMKKIYILTLSLMAVVFFSGCVGQQPEKVYHIGILSGFNTLTNITNTFEAKMTDLGYVEGKNVVYDVQNVGFNTSAYGGALDRLVADKVDLILVYPTEASLEAKTVVNGTGIPVVFAFASTEDNGLVNSIREPGNNVTGVRYPGPEIAAKTLETLVDIDPKVKNVLVPYYKDYPSSPSQIIALESAASALNVTLIELPATGLESVNSFFEKREKMNDTGIDAIVMIADPLRSEVASAVSNFSLSYKIPCVGGVMSENESNSSAFAYSTNVGDYGTLAASLADEILRGVPAGKIPVVTPNYGLQVNYKVLQDIGLNVSEGFLAMADDIIR